MLINNKRALLAINLSCVMTKRRLACSSWDVVASEQSQPAHLSAWRPLIILERFDGLE